MPIPTELLAAITDQLTPNGAPPTPGEAIKVWNSVFARFDPLLGPLSTQLLFARALRFHENAFPWLPQAGTPDEARESFTTFAGSLDGQPADEMLAANQALLATFSTQLAELIGARLATQFLRSAFALGDAKEE
jgi:hypothetical protein